MTTDTHQHPFLKRLLIWRVKHISERNFILILSGVLGIASGLAALVMRSFTHFIQWVLDQNLAQQITYGFYFVLPVIGFTLVYILKRYVIRKDVNQGIPSILYAVAHQKGIMKRYQSYASLITAPITIGFGGSVGLEGPMVVTGAGISSNLSRFFHINQSNRMLLLACACAGALAAIFKIPIAAILFAIEVFGLDLTLSSLLPLLISSLCGIFTSYFFFGSEVLIPMQITRAFSLQGIPFYIALGVVGGLMSAYFMFVNEHINRFFNKLGAPWKRILIGGAVLGLLIFVMPPLYGEGHEIINNLKEGHPERSLTSEVFAWDLSNPWVIIALLAFLSFVKVIATTVTLSAGGVGGIFSPMLFMGGVMGNCFARIINEFPILGYKAALPNFTLVGMTALMAGVLHAPLTAVFLIAEVTGGYSLLVPAMLTAAVSYSVARYFNQFSIYTTELGRRGELISQNKDQSILTLMDFKDVVEHNFVPVYTDMKLREVVYEVVRNSSRNIYPVLDRETHRLEGIILLDNIRHLIFETDYYDKIPALELMQKPPAVVQYGKDKMSTVMDKFQQTGAWNLPVVKGGIYCGFISKSKLLSIYRRKLIFFTQ